MELHFIDGVQYVIYEDFAYNWRSLTDAPFQGSILNNSQGAFNSSMSKFHVTVRCIFKKSKIYFPMTINRNKIKLWEAPVGLLYIITLLLCNFRTSIYPSQIFSSFSLTPHFLEEHITKEV